MTEPDPPTRTFSDALTAAIQDRGLSLERIRARLEAAHVPVSIATLSYWQSGRSLPTRSRSYHTLVELEKILNLEPGHLTTFTHTSDGRTRRELFAWQTVLPVRELAAQIISDLGIDMQGQLARVMMSDLLTVAADRTEAVQESRTVWRAERNGLHRWAVVLEQDATEPGALPTIEPVFGCSVGEVVEVPERHLLVAEMLAPRPLVRGDVFSAEYRITFAHTSTPSFRMSRSAAETVRMIGLGVRFHPDALPCAIEARISPSIERDEYESLPVELAGNEAQIVHTDAKPGVYYLNWEWD